MRISKVSQAASCDQLIVPYTSFNCYPTSESDDAHFVTYSNNPGGWGGWHKENKVNNYSQYCWAYPNGPTCITWIKSCSQPQADLTDSGTCLIHWLRLWWSFLYFPTLVCHGHECRGMKFWSVNFVLSSLSRTITWCEITTSALRTMGKHIEIQPGERNLVTLACSREVFISLAVQLLDH